VLLLHRQRLVAEATVAALQQLAPDLQLEVSTGAADARAQLAHTELLLAEPDRLPAGPRWGSPADPDSARYVALGSLGNVDRASQAITALRAGASAWVPSDTTPELLLHACRVALDGDLWLPPDLVVSILLRLLNAPRTVQDDLDLSPRERVVLDLVAAGRTNREIAAELHLSPNTVRTHRQRLFRKIDAHSAVQAASWLRGHRPDQPSAAPRLRWDAP
jgi:DNA-binding CsgD family transcriptional regulator